MEFFVRNGKIVQGNQVVSLRGINWFGAETETRCVHALWEANLDDLISVLRTHSFNAVRLTISAETMLGLDTLMVSGIDASKNKGGLEKMTCGQVMDVVVRKLRDAGILVMFNMHRMKPFEEISELWYTTEYPEARVIQAWRNLATRYRNSPNVFAMDIKNEPHGKSSWGGARETDWAAACERIGNEILKVSPKVLICVAGVTMDIWGDDVDGARTRPVKLNVPNKVFYSPHFYRHWRFPNKEGFSHIPYLDRCMGKLIEKGECVVVGEYGYDHTNESERQWVKEFAEYLKRVGLVNVFYWCLNENGALNHTILNKDWKSVISEKVNLIKAITPNPSKFSFTAQRPPTPIPPQRPVTPPPSRPVTPRPVTPQPRPTIPEPNRPSSSSNGNARVSIKTLAKNQWENEQKQKIIQQEVSVTNTSNTDISDVEVSVVPVGSVRVQQSYSATMKNDGNVNSVASFPGWQIQNKLKPGQTWVFGFQTINTLAKVTVSRVLTAKL